jgi:hypothetical protein
LIDIADGRLGEQELAEPLDQRRRHPHPPLARGESRAG